MEFPEVAPQPLPQIGLSQFKKMRNNRMSMQVGHALKKVWKCQYDYEAEDDPNFKVEEDETIKVLLKYGYDENDTDWWTVKNQSGREGYIPADYLKEEIIIEEPKEEVKKVSALYNYQAQKNDEMTFQKGDQIQILEQKLLGWWKGKNLRDNSIGLFPTNYIQLPHSLPPTPQQDNQTYPFFAIAIANYTSQTRLKKKQHTFKKGEIFKILSLNSPGWYDGIFVEKKNQEIALIPGNYIEPTSWEDPKKVVEKNSEVPKHSTLRPRVTLNQNLSKKDQPTSKQVLFKAPPPSIPVEVNSPKSPIEERAINETKELAKRLTSQLGPNDLKNFENQNITSNYSHISSDNQPLLGKKEEKSSCCIIV